MLQSTGVAKSQIQLSNWTTAAERGSERTVMELVSYSFRERKKEKIKMWLQCPPLDISGTLHMNFSSFAFNDSTVWGSLPLTLYSYRWLVCLQIFPFTFSDSLPLSLSPSPSPSPSASLSVSPSPPSLFCALLISKQVRAGEQFPLWLTSIQPWRLVSQGCYERGAAVVPSPGDQVSPEMPGEYHLELPDQEHPGLQAGGLISLSFIHSGGKCTCSTFIESARQDHPPAPQTKTVYRSGKSQRWCSQKEPAINLGTVPYLLCYFEQVI